MKLSPEQRQQLIAAIKGGDIKQLTEIKKESTGEKVVLSSFLDMMKFFNCVDENRNDIDRQAQIESGEIQVEWRDPLKTALENLQNENYS
ncbi:MAG TPA: hypothetical protein VGN63_19545 [Flavisolibacter sp.]|jgi:hypothetical protein|nr:hypothetical protein [Flavisolibacter sp.]